VRRNESRLTPNSSRLPLEDSRPSLKGSRLAPNDSRLPLNRSRPAPNDSRLRPNDARLRRKGSRVFNTCKNYATPNKTA
jgi:hypothetical protein